MLLKRQDILQILLETENTILRYYIEIANIDNFDVPIVIYFLNDHNLLPQEFLDGFE